MSGKVYGIDLGTTYSCIAAVDEYGKPSVIKNFEGESTTPSAVYFEKEGRVVGSEARNAALTDPESVVEMVKRQMGNADYRFFYDDIDYTAEEISSFVLRKVVSDAEQLVGEGISDVVITCPAYFDSNAREATAKAGEIAGLNVVSIINEPTAAAIAHGINQDQDTVALIYDLGGGTFDITMIVSREGEIEVIATGGDHNLGGRNWDEVILSYLVEEWKEATGSSEDPLDDPETLQDLWQNAEKAKKTLSTREETTVRMLHGGERQSIKLTKSKFDELTANLLAKTIGYTKDMLEEAKKKGFDKFEQFLLVGGSSRMPQVKEKITKEFGVEPQLLDPDEIVAKGAALYGQMLAVGEKLRIKLEGWGIGDVQEASDDLRLKAEQEVAEELGLSLPNVQRMNIRVSNVTSRSFGVEVVEKASGDTIVSNLVRINDKVPVEVTERFGTLDADQRTAKIRVMQNRFTEGSAPLEESEEIGVAELELPHGLSADSPIEITFKLDGEGRLHVFGSEPSSGQNVEARFETKNVISDEELAAAKARSEQLSVS